MSVQLVDEKVRFKICQRERARKSVKTRSIGTSSGTLYQYNGGMKAIPVPIFSNFQALMEIKRTEIVALTLM